MLVISGRKKMNLKFYIALLNSRERVGGYCSKIEDKNLVMRVSQDYKKRRNTGKPPLLQEAII